MHRGSIPKTEDTNSNEEATLDDKDEQEQPLIPTNSGFSEFGGEDDEMERLPLTGASYYEITDVTEMGRMASLFFNKIGKNLFYICIVIYLYGDLAIYGAAVSKSVRDVTCTYRPPSNSSTTVSNISESEKCWEWAEQSRIDVYRIVLAIFVCTLGQFVFCNVTKTKYLQIVTTIMR